MDFHRGKRARVPLGVFSTHLDTLAWVFKIPSIYNFYRKSLVAYTVAEALACVHVQPCDEDRTAHNQLFTVNDDEVRIQRAKKYAV